MSWKRAQARRASWSGQRLDMPGAARRVNQPRQLRFFLQ